MGNEVARAEPVDAARAIVSDRFPDARGRFWHGLRVSGS
jgi:hypothetical protein